MDREELERTGQPADQLRERARDLRDFHVLAFSVSFENDYLHVLQMLRLAGIPLRAADRGPRDPLVILGGAAMFLNPEPLAPFADLIAVGEGEALVPAMMDALLGAPDAARRASQRCTEKDGFYVPVALRGALPRRTARWPPTTGPGRVIRQRGWPGKMAAAAVGDPHPEHRDVHEVHGGDLARLPVHVPLLLGRATTTCPCAASRARRSWTARARCGRHANKIGLVSTAVCDHPEIDGIVDDLAGHGLRGLGGLAAPRRPHARSSCFKLADTGVQGLTLAPECGTDRMRRILNKQFTNDDILDKATWIFENGIQNLKLYYMVGLPWEKHEDVEGIVTLTEQIRDAHARGRPRRAAASGRIHPSVNPFVPKPGTPYQWLPMEDPKETDRKLQFLRKAFGTHAQRGRDHQERAHRRLAVDPGPGRPPGGRRARARVP